MLNDALLGELARQYGTPSYIFDESALEERIAAVREIFGADIRLCYSIKANPFLIPAALENWTDWKSAAPANWISARRWAYPAGISYIPVYINRLKTAMRRSLIWEPEPASTRRSPGDNCSFWRMPPADRT